MKRDNDALVDWLNDQIAYYLDQARTEKYAHGYSWGIKRNVSTARFFNRMLLLTRRAIRDTEGAPQ